MKHLVPLLLLLACTLPVAANHNWAEIDICEVYKDRLPPELTLDGLPDAESRGALLLDNYCTQCHNLPGPDRHTAAEWREVTSRMFMLMNVSHRFGGLMGRIEVIQLEDQVTLLAYLEHHSTNSVTLITPSNSESGDSLWLPRSLALLPLFLLVGFGLLRWWCKARTGHKSCA
ncbi:MAG: hypothetical protein GY703_12575 [Gammaproteobacteria bacterium]|nr:hypothetical protein [Gammaproteobacteria bacterium]